MMAADQRAANVDGMQWTGDIVESEGGESYSGSESDNENEDKRQFGIYQCLPVDDGEPEWEAGEPQTVEEYLRRVRYEARHLPDVVTSNLDPRQFDGQRTPAMPAVPGDDEPECPADLKPSIPWVKGFLQDFSALRQQLQSMEHLLQTGQLPGQQHLGEGSQAAVEEGAAAAQQQLKILSLESCSALMPELEALRGLDQVRVLQELQHHVQRVLKSGRLTADDSALFYALSARVERPLHGDTSALYCSLLRHCVHLRAGLPSPRDPLLPHLNVLIAIAGGLYGQDAELAGLWEED